MRKLTNEEFIRRVKEIHPEITPRQPYTLVTNPTEFECDNGHVWTTTPHSIFRGSGCPTCAIESRVRPLEDIQMDLDEIHPGYRIVGEYKNTILKTKVECPKGHIFEANANSLLRGHGCPTCQRIDPDGFEFAFSTLCPTYKLKSRFVDSATKIEVECDKGHTWMTLPYNVLHGRGCPECKRDKISQALRKTQEQFEYELSLINPTFIVKGEYKTINCPIEIQCENGHTWNPIASDILHNKRECPVCYEERMHEKFVSDMSIINPKIKIRGRYKNASTKIEVECDSGHIFESSPKNLLEGCGCFECFNIARTKKHDDFVKELHTKHPDVKVIGVYSGARTKIEFECKEGHTFTSTPDRVLRGSYCPVCMSPKGERRIAKYLDDNHIKYEKYVEYDGLLGVGGGNLSYDFYVPSLNLLIEHHGIQHEKPVDFKGLGEKYAQEAFEKQVEHDRRKGEYAKNHNIPLLVIWYKDFDNIETILTNYISKAA